MKRVLIFSLAYYPYIGGAEIALKEVTDRIPDAEFHLITLRFAREPREALLGKVRVHRVGAGSSYLQKMLYPLYAARLAARLHRAEPFDAFWAMMSYMLFPIVLLRFAGIRVPYLLTLQEGDPWERTFSRWFILPVRPLLRLGFRNAAAVQAISTFLAAWAKRMGYRGAVEVIPNGVDTRALAALPLRTGGLTLLTTSRLVRKNALDVVMRALPLLPESARFIVYGSGPEEPALRKLAQRLSVEGRVSFKGRIEYERLPEALAEGDIFIRPSRSEGMGNSFIEAMAAGLPVIGTQEGGIADFLFDAARNPDKLPTGWAVDADSPEQIAGAVRQILSDPEAARRVTARAREMVIRTYDWNDIAARLSRVLQGL